MHHQPALFDSMPALRRPRPGVEARLRKCDGQFLAASKAGTLWAENMMVALRRYLLAVRSKWDGMDCSGPVFTFEGFRVFCELEGMAAPASINAWGSLPLKAAKLGICRWSGSVTPGMRAASHGRLLKVWIAL